MLNEKVLVFIFAVLLATMAGVSGYLIKKPITIPITLEQKIIESFPTIMKMREINSHCLDFYAHPDTEWDNGEAARKTNKDNKTIWNNFLKEVGHDGNNR